MQNFSKFISAVLFLFFTLNISHKVNATEYDINISISGTQEVPPNASPGEGILTGSYDDNTNILSFGVSFSGLTGNTNAAHFHGPAAFGVNAPIRIFLAGFPLGVTSGNYGNVFALSFRGSRTSI
ncbi:MAG: CHRD domain-containing protein [Ignavibacteria bacterium]|nr:CHRD domain-containing protein [Ignavibacteria bacterium]